MHLIGDNLLVSFIISAYNAERYISQALESVLNQSFSDLEILVIDDGSTDQTLSIIESYQDSRLLPIKSRVNKGLPTRLNQLLKIAQGDYIARLDADDICLPKRIELQVQFMETHLECGVLGGGALIYGSRKRVNYPINNREVRNNLFVNTPFSHPTVMFRREAILRDNIFYNEKFLLAQDYELWTRLLEVTEGYNLNVPVILYRQSKTQSSVLYTEKQNKYKEITQLNQLSRLIEATREEKALHLKVINNNWEYTSEFVIMTLGWIEKIIVANEVKKVYSEPEFSNMLTRYAFNNLLLMLKSSKDFFDIFFGSSLTNFLDYSLRDKFKRFIFKFPGFV